MRHLAARCRPIPEEALEIISDVLLASSPEDGENPALNEHQLARKGRRASNAEVEFSLAFAEKRLFEAGDEETPSLGMTPRQRLVWGMYLDGHSPSDIAAALGITRPTAVRILRNAAGAIAATRTRLRGLREVYRAEVRRKEYRKPGHCFEEPCRNLGYCKYAHIRM